MASQKLSGSACSPPFTTWRPFPSWSRMPTWQVGVLRVQRCAVGKPRRVSPLSAAMPGDGSPATCDWRFSTGRRTCAGSSEPITTTESSSGPGHHGIAGEQWPDRTRLRKRAAHLVGLSLWAHRPRTPPSRPKATTPPRKVLLNPKKFRERSPLHWGTKRGSGVEPTGRGQMGPIRRTRDHPRQARRRSARPGDESGCLPW